MSTPVEKAPVNAGGGRGRAATIGWAAVGMSTFLSTATALFAMPAADTQLRELQPQMLILALLLIGVNHAAMRLRRGGLLYMVLGVLFFLFFLVAGWGVIIRGFWQVLVMAAVLAAWNFVTGALYLIGRPRPGRAETWVMTGVPLATMLAEIIYIISL